VHLSERMKKPVIAKVAIARELPPEIRAPLRLAPCQEATTDQLAAI
jgi:hypothetical protein